MSTSNSPENELRKGFAAMFNPQKEFFTSKLSKQLEDLPPKLDEQQGHNLRSMSVDKVVNGVTNTVIENVVKEGLALHNGFVNIPLHLLTRDTVTKLVGKISTRDEVSERFNNQLLDVAAATYVSETAQAILSCISGAPSGTGTKKQLCFPKDANDNFKQLISAAALAACPVTLRYSSDGTRLRNAWGRAGAVVLSVALAPEVRLAASVMGALGGAAYIVWG